MYVICDVDLCERSGWTLVDFAFACVEGGARLLQVRAKRTSTVSFLDQTIAIVGRAERAGALVIVNDRADVARLAGAPGVHVGQDDLPPSAVRSILGDSAVVGLSTHTTHQILEAVNEPISYLAVGPVFGTATKDTGYAAVGIDRVCEAIVAARPRSLPVVAIGGITLERAPAILACGASSVAVASDLFSGQNPEKRVRTYLDRLTG